MEKKLLVLSIKSATVFNDKKDRLKFGFVFNEKFTARKLDKDTGEFVIKDDNELSFTKKQFNFALQDKFIVSLLSKSIDYSTMSAIKMLGMFKNAKLTIERTRLEEGDTYVDVNGEEQTADDFMFITELKDIKFSDKNIQFIKSLLIKSDSELDMEMLDLLF